MATTGAVFASSNAADGTLTGWTNPTYAYSDNAEFATREGTTKSQWYGTLYGFDLSGIPDGATITSVTLLARWYNSANDTNGPVFFLGAKSGGSEVGSGTTDTTGQTGEENVTYQPTGLSAANLKATGASGFWAIVRFRRTDNTSHTAYLDYVTCTVVYTVTHALTSTDAASGIPVVESATIGQKHKLTGTDVASGIPVVESPTLGQKHALTATDIATPAPTIDTPTLVNVPPQETFELTADNIASGIPVVETATLGQVHKLTGADIATPVPTVESATIGQVHTLTAGDIASGIPSADKATLGQVHALTGSDITTPVPVIDKPVLSIATIPVVESEDVSSSVFVNTWSREYSRLREEEELILSAYLLMEL